MHTGDDDNDFAINSIVDPIGEAADKQPPGISMNHRMPGWMCGNVVKGGLNGGKKISAQASTLALVPEKRFVDIRRSRWAKND